MVKNFRNNLEKSTKHRKSHAKNSISTLEAPTESGGDVLVADIVMCPTCCVFNRTDFFETLDRSNQETIWHLDENSKFSGVGAAWVQLIKDTMTFRFPALHIPQSSPNIIPNVQILQAGGQVTHGLRDPPLLLPDSARVPMNLSGGISIVQLTKQQPFNAAFSAELWMSYLAFIP